MTPTCLVCGHPMPKGEEMFKMHGYSGPCPEPPLIPAWLVRVKAERYELADRVAKLLAFIGSPQFERIDEAERGRLRRQYAAMSAYGEVLCERIKAAEAP